MVPSVVVPAMEELVVVDVDADESALEWRAAGGAIGSGSCGGVMLSTDSLANLFSMVTVDQRLLRSLTLCLLNSLSGSKHFVGTLGGSLIDGLMGDGVDDCCSLVTLTLFETSDDESLDVNWEAALNR